MTREEAIEILKDLWRTKHSTYLEADIRKALDMAINALTQECVGSTQKHVGTALNMRCDDAISRQSVKSQYTDDEIQAMQDLEQAEIQKAYEVGQEDRPTGHWIFKKFDEKSGISDSCWCSKCNKPLASVYKNFCPNCGAKMVEPQESEDKE